MNNDPKITIIIPHFNSSMLLKKLLETIPNKNDLEIIVVDDCSNIDEYNSISILQKITNSFRLFKNPTNTGAGGCRNIGLKHAIGEWILFADSDDYFLENFYEKISKYFNNPSDVIFFMPTSIYMDTKKIANRHVNYSSRLQKYLKMHSKINELEVRYKFEVPWSKMIKRELLIKNNIWFEEVKASNDLLFSTKVGFYMNKFEISEDIIYTVTKSSYSLIENKSKEVFYSRVKEKEKYYHYLKERLDKNEIKSLNISFLLFLLRVKKYGFIELLLFFKYLVQKKLPIFDNRLIEPITLFNYMKNRKKMEKL